MAISLTEINSEVQINAKIFYLETYFFTFLGKDTLNVCFLISAAVEDGKFDFACYVIASLAFMVSN